MPKRKTFNGDYECTKCGQGWEVEAGTEDEMQCECGGALEEVEEGEAEDEDAAE